MPGSWRSQILKLLLRQKETERHSERVQEVGNKKRMPAWRKIANIVENDVTRGWEGGGVDEWYCRPKSYGMSTNMQSATFWRARGDLLPDREFTIFFLTLVIPMCLSNTYTVRSISQNTTVYYIKYYFKTTCFDSFESSSGPSRNRSIAKVHVSIDTCTFAIIIPSILSVRDPRMHRKHW